MTIKHFKIDSSAPDTSTKLNHTNKRPTNFFCWLCSQVNASKKFQTE